MKKLGFAILLLVATKMNAQQVMTPELLWKLGRVSAMGISKDGKYVVYRVSMPDVEANKSSAKKYLIPVEGGTAVEIQNTDSLLSNNRISPDGKYVISDEEVKIEKITGSDFYPALSKSNVYIFDKLNDRHWDTWEDGKYNHVFLSEVNNPSSKKDLMPALGYDCPTKPFGGEEDYVWSADSKQVVYVTKAKTGTAYATSTNTDLFAYDIATGKTSNITEGMYGYDLNPSFNSKNELAWLSMKRDGYEADKQDIIVWNGVSKLNLTKSRDDIHVESFAWGNDAKTIFFTAPMNGTLQLFKVNYPGNTRMLPVIEQITKGDFDISGIIGQTGNTLVVTRTDMNHAAEIYTVDLTNGNMKQLSHVNDETYNSIQLNKTERRMVKTTDGKEMLVWVIYPPGFDANKK